MDTSKNILEIYIYVLKMGYKIFRLNTTVDYDGETKCRFTLSHSTSEHESSASVKLRSGSANDPENNYGVSGFSIRMKQDVMDVMKELDKYGPGH